MSRSTSLNFLDLFQEFRAVGEFARFAGNAWTWRMNPRARLPRAILLIPGFMAGDATLYPFANWLRSRGHQVHFSGILANADCPKRAMARLERILQDLFDRYDEKLVVIGHSLCGIYARELARRMPECVDQAVLLGSPIRNPAAHANPLVKMLATLTMRMQETARG
jgi:pimeloyl-ACP methyl ester carboxylesterase